ncbi:hypothetical protein HOY80DRAFT_970500 [Tuber brumale]|nr:hypothetical protein HOY80DRAFT_970500 [Tuber brumale]
MTLKPPTYPIRKEKREPLLVFIRGCLSNETSPQSIPGHLHNLLWVASDDLGWYVHTKVYAMFKTRHGCDITGHSLGGP